MSNRKNLRWLHVTVIHVYRNGKLQWFWHYLCLDFINVAFIIFAIPYRFMNYNSHLICIFWHPLILIYNVAHLNVNLYFSRLYFSNNLCFSLTNNKNSLIWSYRPHFVFWFYKHYESGLQSMSVHYTCLLFLEKTI